MGCNLMSQRLTTGVIGLGRRVDPLAGINIIFRLQTHNGDGVPLGLYQDESCTTPATSQNDPVVAIRDEITESGVIAIDNGSVQEAYLDFIGGVPTVRTTINTRFEIEDIAGYFDGEGGLSVGYEVISAGESQSIVGSGNGIGFNGHFDRFFATETAYSQLFFATHRSDNNGPTPLSGKHTISTIHNGTDWKRYVDGGQSGITVSGQDFGFLGTSMFFMGGFSTDANQEGRFTGIVAGPSWSDVDRERVENFLVAIQPKEIHIGFFGDSNTAGTVIGAGNSFPSQLETVMLDRLILCDSNNLGGSGTTSQNWADGISIYIGFLEGDESHVVVMLGTNDCKTSNSFTKATYKANGSTIANAIISDGRIPIFIPIPYPTPGALGEWDAGSPALAESYNDAIEELAAEIEGCRFFDTGLYAYTQANPGTMTDGIHITTETSGWVAGKLADYFEVLAS